MGDFLRDLIRQAVAASMESPAALAQLETRLRQEIGSQRKYIRATMPETDSGSPESPQRVSTDSDGTLGPRR
jgi:hypothetical protein